MTKRSLVRFGVFELDGRTGELRKHGVRLKLQDQPFQVLQALLERPGELVTREELQGKERILGAHSGTVCACMVSILKALSAST